MKLHYLEIVTPDVDRVCATTAAAQGLDFGPPVAALGNARTAPLAGGGRVGVRAPLRADEQPVVRPYYRVDDIQAALAAVQAAGGVVALPAMEISGQGTIAITQQGGVDLGLWQD